MNIAKAFGTPGIKAGQQISIWKLLGESMAARLEGLKDNAGPMSLLEILDVVRQGYPATVADRSPAPTRQPACGTSTMRTIPRSTRSSTSVTALLGRYAPMATGSR